MDDFVQNDAFLRFGNRVGRATDLNQVHRSLVDVDETDFFHDLGP
jgi:hypothetical protein